MKKRIFTKIISLIMLSVVLAGAIPAHTEAAGRSGYSYNNYMQVFDPDYYAILYPEVGIACNFNRDLLLKHFVETGMPSGMRGCREFDPVWYRQTYPDVAASCGDNWSAYYREYITSGIKKRAGSAEVQQALNAASTEAARIAGGRFYSANGATYFQPAGGGNFKGWISYGGKYYYLDRWSGALHINDKVDGISISSDGSAIMDQYATEKIPVMIKARQIAYTICSDKDTLSTKVCRSITYAARFNYILKDAYIGDHRYKYACPEAHYANNMLNVYGDQVVIGGECYAQCSVAAFILHELNVPEVWIEDNMFHGWLFVDGHYYDPGIALQKDFFSNFDIKIEGIPEYEISGYVRF